MTQQNPNTYKSAGVDIDAGNEAVQRIKPHVKRTFTPHVLSQLGGFAGYVELPKGYKEPVLVGCTDGVGTKLRLAIEANTFDTVGIDLVAMSVNDLICCGAKPLYFLDYIACHHINPDQMEQLLKGIADGCVQADCALIGGEMAEMNDMYQHDDFDLAGFATGVVEKSKIIDGSRIQSGDYIYAIPSSGIHSNGYSLVRKVLPESVRRRENIAIETVLEPTRIYVKAVQQLIEKYDIVGLAHITGGGLMENISRIIPHTLRADIDKSGIKVPEIFKKIQHIGKIESEEMWRVFNMGVGMTIISKTVLPESDDLYEIGRIL